VIVKKVELPDWIINELGPTFTLEKILPVIIWYGVEEGRLNIPLPSPEKLPVIPSVDCIDPENIEEPDTRKLPDMDAVSAVIEDNVRLPWIFSAFMFLLAIAIFNIYYKYQIIKDII